MYNHMSRVWNDSGMTLIEALISLFTLAFMLSFIPLIIQFFNTDDTVYDFDYDLFVIDLMESYQLSETVSTNHDQSMINFLTPSGNVSYRLNVNRIIKSIDGAGFITMLFNVDTMQISETEHTISMQIIGGSSNGEEMFVFQR